MKIYSISKLFRFEAAHRLVAPYSGKCNHVHGHSWTVKVTIVRDHLDANGMVLDFFDLTIFKDWIADHLDHSTLVSENDHALMTWLLANGQKHFVISGNPTSESLAQLIFETLESFGFTPDAVEISETCTSSACYRYDHNHIR